MSEIPGVRTRRHCKATHVVLFLSLGVLLSVAGCTGPMGIDGPAGPAGPPGQSGIGDGGTQGQQGCPGLSAGQTVGIAASIQVSAPPNGGYFATGDRPVLTMRLTNGCGQVLRPSDVGTANLYVSGPRPTLKTKAAVKLLNANTDRTVPDRQHHMINLQTPRYANPAQANLSVGNDGTMTYSLAAVSDEVGGTYTAGIWAVSRDGVDQILETKAFQIGTATVETYASGDARATPPTSTCYDCHLGSKSGKSYQAHILPGFSPFGNYALDQTPITNCQLCHNNDGYSVNPTVRKVHAAHRGEHQLAAGVAHPDYGLGTDATLREYLNIGFPSLFAKEKDCQKCHTDDRWKTSPSRLACGTCHDNLFFDSGTLNPPRNFGRPMAGACTVDANCAAFGDFVTCNAGTGNCERRTHPLETSDAQCATCHPADSPGLAPIAAVHAIYERTGVRGLRLINYQISGSTGPNGAFLLGDTPTVRFKITTRTGQVVSDLITNPALSGSLVVAGPSDDRQRIYGPNGTVNIKTSGTLTYDAGTTLYTYVFPNPIPAQAFPPLNNPSATPRANASGSYTTYLYVNEAFTNPTSFRDYASIVQDFSLTVGGVNAPIRTRQVISNAACNSCHVETVAHGTSRRDAEACSMCHTAGAQDRIVGGLGRTCTVDPDCPGFAAGWEHCVSGTCTITTDPTPNISIKFPTMVHKIHFARLLEGYAERQDIVFPGRLAYVGFQNSVVNLSEILFPQDVRNCTKCHADSGATCTTTTDCGIGQECKSGKCENRAWIKPSTEGCISCHDSADAFAHAQLNTFQSPDGPIESCDVCHGEHGDFSVEKVHNISNPYVPPYPRTKE